MVIVVRSIVDGADTAEQGARLLPHLVDAIASTSGTTVSFEGLVTATSSFTNASFVQLLRHTSFDDIKRKLRIVGSTKQINLMIRSRLEREALHCV